MTQLHETESGLLVPESALPPAPPPSSVVNPFEIVFPAKEIAERFAGRCAVRWQYFLSMVNTAGEDDPPKWRAIARKGNGIVHDTQSPSYIKDENDTKLATCVDVKKHNDKAFTLVNKF